MWNIPGIFAMPSVLSGSCSSSCLVRAIFGCQIFNPFIGCSVCFSIAFGSCWSRQGQEALGMEWLRMEWLRVVHGEKSNGIREARGRQAIIRALRDASWQYILWLSIRKNIFASSFASLSILTLKHHKIERLMYTYDLRQHGVS
jgi:hypothetical protein